MKRKVFIQLKAAFLIIVFSMNTIIGFACSIDMVFNSTYHTQDAIEASVHVHANSKKHVHNEIKSHHDKSDKDHHKSKNSKDNCCNDQVLKFTRIDKSVAPSFNFAHPIFFIAYISFFYNIDISFLTQATPNIKYFIRSHHPPIPDIRLAIRSFQI